MFYHKSKKRSNFREANKIWSRIVLPMILSVLHCYSQTFFRFAIAALPEQLNHRHKRFLLRFVSNHFIQFIFTRDRNEMWDEVELNCGNTDEMEMWSSQYNRNINLTNCKIWNSEAMWVRIPYVEAPWKFFSG